jgi:sigma-B regulation protein RsbU (phosphoserine phosphatase)
MLEINDTLAKMLGYEKKELLGESFEKLLNIAGRIFFQTHFFPLLKMHSKAEEIFLSLLAKNGELIPVIANAAFQQSASGSVNSCVFIPVYNRRKYEDEILAAKRSAETALAENRELIMAREELVRHGRELDKRIRELNRMNLDLMQFNNIINHDMQSCVRKILLFTQLAGTEKDFTYLSNIRQSAIRLKSINRSLDLFINLDSNQETHEPVQLNKVINDSLKQIIADTEFSNIIVQCPELPSIEGNISQLGILFYELFSNAIKFRASDNVKVNIEAKTYESNIYHSLKDKYQYEEVLEISFSDNGKGFNMEHKDYVLNMLKKLNPNSSDLGIGLTFCKKIMDLHQGKLTVTSQPEIGTTIGLVFPLRQINNAVALSGVPV